MKIHSIQHQLMTHSTKKYQCRTLSDIHQIVIHHSATRNGTPFSYANYHVTQHGWPGIGYHYVIQKDGTVYKCNQLTTISYHVSGHNRRSVGICLTGDFRLEEPTTLQYRQALALTQQLLETLSLSTSHVFGHRELRGHHSNHCPGISMVQFRKNLVSLSSRTNKTLLKKGDRGEVVKKLQRQLKQIGIHPGPVDGIFGPLTEQAVRQFQRSRHLSEDGLVGKNTWHALEIAFA